MKMSVVGVGVGYNCKISLSEAFKHRVGVLVIFSEWSWSRFTANILKRSWSRL